MASNSHFPKSDREVNEIDPFDFTDFEEAEENLPEYVDGEMPCNLADQFRCAIDTLYFANADYTNGKFHFLIFSK